MKKLDGRHQKSCKIKPGNFSGKPKVPSTLSSEAPLVTPKWAVTMKDPPTALVDALVTGVSSDSSCSDSDD